MPPPPTKVGKALQGGYHLLGRVKDYYFGPHGKSIHPCLQNNIKFLHLTFHALAPLTLHSIIN